MTDLQHHPQRGSHESRCGFLAKGDGAGKSACFGPSDPADEVAGGAYRRLLVDTHVPDWDPRLLAKFDAAEYVRTIAQAGFDLRHAVRQVARGVVPVAEQGGSPAREHARARLFWRGHEGMPPRAASARWPITPSSSISGLSIIIPEWRIIPENGIDGILKGRPGVVCPNSPYRERALAELRELVINYDFQGIFLDMTFWPDVCYCPHCTARFRKEHNDEPPRIINWDDPMWRTFQKAREQWLLEFALLVTKTIKDVRPITVNHQFSTVFHDWRRGVPLDIRDACDYVGGDFYGGPTQYSLACKVFYGLSRVQPF